MRWIHANILLRRTLARHRIPLQRSRLLARFVQFLRAHLRRVHRLRATVAKLRGRQWRLTRGIERRGRRGVKERERLILSLIRGNVRVALSSYELRSIRAARRRELEILEGSVMKKLVRGGRCVRRCLILRLLVHRLA